LLSDSFDLRQIIIDGLYIKSLLSLVVGRNAVEKVLDCPFGVVEGGSECSLALIPREPHRHKIIQLLFSLVILIIFG